METLETLGRRIGTTEDLQSIVRTMKSLSAVSIRQYDQAVLALREYNRTIEMGLQVVLRSGHAPATEPGGPPGPTVAIVFGSDHGLCGRFNGEIVRFAREALSRQAGGEGAVFLVAGERVASELEATGEQVAQRFRLPGSVTGLTDTAHDILLDLDDRRSRHGAGRVLLFHNRRADGAAAAPHAVQLLPLAADWLQRLAARHWQSRSLPTFTMDTRDLLAALVRQHLFIGLFRAGAELAASEHAMRLSAMQAAERNIEESLDDMNMAYRQRRQQSVTEELLDIVAGFEALTTSR